MERLENAERMSHDAGPGDPPPSRRAANKARTRQQIVDAALELFSERGYDDATVDDIARRAGISPRTFFRYFETKERVLFFGLEDFFRALVTRYLELPQSESDLDDISRAIAELAPRLEPLADRISRYYLAIESSVALRGRDRDERTMVARLVSDAIAQRHGHKQPTVDDDLVSALAVLLVERALRRWLASGASRPLAPLYADERRRLARLSAGSSADGRIRTGVT